MRREYLIIPHLDSDGGRRRARGFSNLALDRLPSARCWEAWLRCSWRGIDPSGAEVGSKIKSAAIPASSETHLL